MSYNFELMAHVGMQLKVGFRPMIHFLHMGQSNDIKKFKHFLLDNHIVMGQHL
jgi:hypothetical protein